MIFGWSFAISRRIDRWHSPYSGWEDGAHRHPVDNVYEGSSDPRNLSWRQPRLLSSLFLKHIDKEFFRKDSFPPLHREPHLTDVNNRFTRSDPVFYSFIRHLRHKHIARVCRNCNISIDYHQHITNMIDLAWPMWFLSPDKCNKRRRINARHLVKRFPTPVASLRRTRRFNGWWITMPRTQFIIRANVYRFMCP